MSTRFNHIRGTFNEFRRIIVYLALVSVISAFGIAAFFSAGLDVHAAAQSTSVPRIIPDGVKVVDAWNMPEAGWQAWLSRPPGDDTYGAGDLFAVSVEFNQEVNVNSNTTFQFVTGWDYERQLVYAAQDGNKVFFATTVGAWHDYDGIYIGDGSQTLGHNDAGFITSVASGAEADISHPELGTLPDHKMNGSVSRPNIVTFELVDPACEDYYLRDEKITIKVNFDQKVRVRGTPQAAIKIKQTEGKHYRRAAYDRGDGTDTIYLEYEVTEKDRDPRGVRIDNNAMLIKRDAGNVPLNKAKVVGARGGLMADLRANGFSRSQTSAVDGSRRVGLYCKTPLPEIPANVILGWNGAQPDSAAYTAEFTVLTDPGVAAISATTTFLSGRMEINGQRFIMGLNNGDFNPRAQTVAKTAFCSTWDLSTARTATHGDKGWQVRPDNVPGSPVTIGVPYDWTTGTYTMKIERTTSEGTTGTFECSITAHVTDSTTGETTKQKTTIGTFGFDSGQGGTTPAINPNFRGFGAGIAYSGHDPVKPVDMPVLSVRMERPKVEGMRRPRTATVAYSTRFGIADNGLVTFDANNQRLTLTAGGSTSHEGVNDTGKRYTFNAKRK